jgi:hypothetical protein
VGGVTDVVITRRRLVVGFLTVAAGAAISRRDARGASAVGSDELGLAPSPVDRPVRMPAPVSLPAATSHLGLRWEGAEDIVAEVRWRRAEGTWGEWRRLERAHDLGDPAKGVWLSGLLVVGHPAEAQVRLLRGAVQKARLVAIDTTPAGGTDGPGRYRTTNAQPAPSNSAGAVIIRRREWGADESLRKGRPSFAPTTRISVHHTVTPNDDPDPASTVRAILAYHTQANGWDDIGYNFLIDAEGRIYEGRWARDYQPGERPTGEDDHGHGVIGAHTGKDNPGTLGVALLGDFRSVAPSSAALEALQTLLAWEADRHHIDPLATTAWSTGERSTVIGHRDAGPTACPGDQLYAALPAIRQAVADQIAARPPGATNPGYWLLTSDGQVHPFGEAPTPASAAAPAPAVSLAPTASGQGYWVLSGDGTVVPFGDARSFGSTADMALNTPVVRLEPTPSGLGYWIVAADGGVFTFGDARFFGSLADRRLGAPVVALVAHPSGKGYWIVAADGGVFSFGDAQFFGSATGTIASDAVVGAAAHPTGEGYWLLTDDGQVLPFGTARSHGDVPSRQAHGQPHSVQIRAVPSGSGYYVLDADGSLFTFGDARFHGTAAGRPDSNPAVDLALRPTRASGASSPSPAS